MSNLIIPTFKTGYARSPGESRAPDLWTGLKGAWLPFLGATGLELRDLLNQHHGTLIDMDPATAWVVEQRYVLDLDGTNYVNVGIHPDFNMGDTFSVSVWMNMTAGVSNANLVSQVVGGSQGWMLYCGGLPDVGRRMSFFVYDYAVDLVTDPSTIPLNQWVHWVGVSDSTYTSLYRDGKLVNRATKGAGSYVHAGGINLQFGKYGANEYYLNGKIGSVLIHNRDLSVNEIAELSSEPYVMWQLAIRPQMKAPGDIVQLTATSAAVVSTTATLTKTGIVDMTATAAAVTSATGSIGLTKSMTATAAAVTSATGGLGIQHSMTATAAAVTSATAKLTFVGEKDFFLDIPIHTLSIDNTTQILKPFTNAIPIDHGLTIDNTTGVIKVETNAIPIPSLSSDAARVRPRTNPGAVLLYTGVYNDFTAEARDNTPDDVDLSQGAGTILYLGYKEKFYAVRIIVSTAGVGSYTMEAAKYWNGAAWVTLAYSDGELNDFKTAEIIHIAGLPNDPDDWAKTTVNGSELYWISMETLSGTQSQKPLAQRIYLQIVGVVASYRFITFSSEEVYQEFF